MRGRGLKRYMVPHLEIHHSVAPHAGAWIETHIALLSYRAFDVAPHAGAWIETTCSGVIFFNTSSPPMRGRGLKLV